jgi:hypothetical protein
LAILADVGNPVLGENCGAVPGRFVDKIKHGTDDKVEGGQTRRGCEFAVIE